MGADCREVRRRVDDAVPLLSRAGVRPLSFAMSRRAFLSAVLLLVVALAIAYSTSFRGALVFDDLPGIAENPTIRDLRRWDLLVMAIGPQGGTLSGRPIPNLSLALNYALSGLELWSYHAFNLAIHICAALALFGLVRRTLLRPVLGGRWAADALPLAVVIAGLWSLHPLQTESVTYLVQRVESMVGLFYLLTLYCFVRAIDAVHPRRWFIATFGACLVGMGCKEVMVSAPLMVWLYDRTFVAASWREVWQCRGRFHLTLASTWLCLGALMLASGNRGGTAGFAVGVHAWNYLLTQSHVILAYLQLALWPHPLVFDHNVQLVSGLAEVFVPALVIVALLAGSAWLLVRRPAAGFLAAAFFAILAPTSSVVPVADAMFEHRMYLPLAALIALLVVGVHRRLGRLALPAWSCIGLAFAGTTAARNLDYHSPLGLWEDTVRKVPTNARAHNSIGAYLFAAEKFEMAHERFVTAVGLDPKFASAHYNLGRSLDRKGDAAGAIAAYEKAVQLNPNLIDAHVNLGHALGRLGRWEDAAMHYEAALRLDATAGDVQGALGEAWLKLKRPDAATPHLKLAVTLEPERAEHWHTLALAHQQQGDTASARRALQEALRLKSAFPEALYLLGNLDIAADNLPAAIGNFQRAVDAAPSYVAARNNLANALLLNGQTDAAIGQYRRILQERPQDRAVQENLARALEIQAAGRPR